MPIRKKKVEFYKVILKTLEDKACDIKLDEILSSKEVLNKEINLKGKDLELKIFANNEDYLVGIIETSRNNNLPPKKSKRAKTLSKLGLNIDEGLAYGNVFLFDKKRNILMYEVNKFGCYLDHFISFLYLALKETSSFRTFKIKLEVVLTSDEYNRIVNMNFHKSIEIQIANPDKMMEEFDHKNGAIYNVCESANDLNSSRVFAKFEVEAKKTKKGLTTKTVREVLNEVTSLLQGRSAENIKKVVVTGYENDIEKLQRIDLIADRYIKEISLDEPRESKDLLEKQRTDAIISLHKGCLNELDSIFL
jgi:hypothetical protein